MTDTTTIKSMTGRAAELPSDLSRVRGPQVVLSRLRAIARRLPSLLTVRAVVSLLGEPPWPLLLLTSGLGWAAIVLSEVQMAAPALCIAASGAVFDQGARAFAAMLTTTAPGDVLVSWIMMLVAMMSLILVMPLRHVWYRSLRRSRVRNISLFLTAFIGGWLIMAPVIACASILLRVLAHLSNIPVAVLAIAVAVVWQMSPWKQLCLNRCHWTPRLSAFGWAAVRDCLGYGIRDVTWCIGTCWALMLIPLAVPEFHVVGMAGVSAIMIGERLRPARAVRWYGLRMRMWSA